MVVAAEAKSLFLEQCNSLRVLICSGGMGEDTPRELAAAIHRDIQSLERLIILVINAEEIDFDLAFSIIRGWGHGFGGYIKDTNRLDSVIDDLHSTLSLLKVAARN
jgi:hypothetical protein